MADISQVNMKEMIREYNDEETDRLINVIMILKLQKQILELQVAEKKRQEDREQRRREYEERREEEKQRRQTENKEEEEMRVQEERRAENEWRQQEMWERRREKNRQRAREERKCFACGGFGHMAYSCREVGEKGPAQIPSNKFEVLKSRIMQKRKKERKEVEKDRKEILREERAKRGTEIRQTKIERKEKKEKYLREVIVKIRLKQEEEEEGIMVDMLLDSRVIGLVISEEFARKHKFRRMKLERPIYVRNMDGTLNYARLIVDTVEVEIYFKGHKERTSIDVIGGQK